MSLIVASMVLVGCGGSGGDDYVVPADVFVAAPSVEVPVTVLPAPVEIVILPSEPVVTIPSKPDNNESEPIFEEVRVGYDQDVDCRGGEVEMKMLFKASESVDPYSFVVLHTVDTYQVGHSEPIARKGELLYKLTDVIKIEENEEDFTVRHGIEVQYYAEDITTLSKHFFDQESCNK